MTKEHFLLREVAKRLGVKPYQIAYALSVGLVEEPECASPTSGFSGRRTSNGSPALQGRTGRQAGEEGERC